MLAACEDPAKPPAHHPTTSSPTTTSLSHSFAPLTQSAEREKMFWETQKLWKPTFFFLCGVLKSEPTQKTVKTQAFVPRLTQ
jgi:hypothetical protein